MTDIKALTLPEIEQLMSERFHQPAYRAGQIYSWLYKGVSSYEQMSDLPKALRDALAKQTELTWPKALQKLVSELDGTHKYLLEMADGESVETVVMRYHYGNSICLSTQAGCRMGCAFCASTVGGLKRSLRASEIVDQLLYAAKDMGEPISHIVLMGIGEPLDNFDEVCTFLRNIAHPKGMGLSLRHVTLSTCGLVDGIYRLAKEKMPLTLSISLHAPNDALREKIMPVAKTWRLDALMRACRDYFAATARRVSFEYILIDGLNDSEDCAKELAGLLSGFPAHVNLIVANDTARGIIKGSRPASVRAFQAVLARLGVNCTLRRTLGADINASCGQLKRGYQNGEVRM